MEMNKTMAPDTLPLAITKRYNDAIQKYLSGQIGPNTFETIRENVFRTLQQRGFLKEQQF